jgi:hypothetical protein
MKRAIIGALVGGFLVFAWQAVSHMFLKHHDSEFKQVPQQEVVIKALSDYFKEDGQYLVPRSNPGASQEEMQKFDESMKGQPFAIVTYHASDKNNMAVAALRSFTTAVLCVFLFIFILGRNPGPVGYIFVKTLSLGFIIFMYVWYNNNIWLQTPWDVLRPELIDIAVAFTLLGLWLAFWLKPGKARNNGYGKGFGV